LPSNLHTEIRQLPLSFRNSAQDPPPSAPPDLTSRSARSAHFLALGAESQRDLQHLPSYPSYFPAASSAASGMLTLEQQIALMNEERQRSRALPTASSSLSDRVLSVEQQLAAYMEERHRRSASTAATNYLPGRALNIDHQQQLAFLLEQQQGRHQPSQAPASAPDRNPNIEQLLASLNDGRRSLQATSSLQNTTSTIDEHDHQGGSGNFQDRRIPSIEQQLASLNDEHQRRYGSFQAASSVQQNTSTLEEHLASLIREQQGRSTYFQDMRTPTMEQHLASLVGAASNSPASYFPSNHMVENQNSQPLSVEDQRLLAQLQRNTAPQAQQESPARGYQLEHAEQGHAEPAAPPPLPSAVPIGDAIAIPPAYGRNGQIEAFPEKLYRLLAEAEKDGNDRIISFTPDGRAFKIHNRQAFIKEVSPKYFRHAKVTSFVRQLNFYGFQKLLDGPNRGAFINPPFIRGHPELLGMVKRKEIAPRPKRSPGHGV
jgi:hypothetical protein